MSVVSKAMTGFLGNSWKTSLLGYGQFLLVTLWSGYQAANGQLTTEGWIQLVGSAVVAVALRVAKDHDVSNAPHPLSEPQQVVPVTKAPTNNAPVPLAQAVPTTNTPVNPPIIITGASSISGQKGDSK